MVGLVWLELHSIRSDSMGLGLSSSSGFGWIGWEWIGLGVAANWIGVDGILLDRIRLTLDRLGLVWIGRQGLARIVMDPIRLD